jgi:hypothetical protein
MKKKADDESNVARRSSRIDLHVSMATGAGTGLPRPQTRSEDRIMSAQNVNQTPPKQWRRRYLISPQFQRKVAMWLALDVFVACMFMGTLLYAIQIQYVRDVVLRPGAGFNQQIVMLNIVFSLAFAILTAAALGISSIVISHRFCGPLYLIGQGLRSISQGRIPSPRNLRKKDELTDFFKLYQDAAAKLQTERRCEIDELDQALRCLKQAAAAGPATAASIQDAIAHIEALRNRSEQWLGVEGQSDSDHVSPTSVSATPVAMTASSAGN